MTKPRNENVGGLQPGEQRRDQRPPEARQQEAQEDARPNDAQSADTRGRDANRSGSDSNAS
jgi:hypothetical protein